MNINKYLRAYTGYFFVYISYKTIFYTLSQICDTLPDEIKDISTTHKYSIGKEILNIIRTREGQGGITLGKNIVLLAKIIAETVVITPLSKAIGFIVMKFPLAKKRFT